MRKGKNRELLLEAIESNLSVLFQSKSSVDDLTEYLSNEHGVSTGKSIYYLGNTSNLREADLELLGLIANYLFETFGVVELDPVGWFLTVEIKKMKSYQYSTGESDEIKLPLTFDNAVYLGDGVYQVAIDMSVIGRLYKYKLLSYNFAFQREAIEVVVGDKRVKKMKIFYKNVKEIKESVLKGKLKKTSLAYNCRVGSTEDDSEYEILFDPLENTLTITEGTVIEILDGTHRTMGIYQAYLENHDIDGKITVLFSNYTEPQAKEYQVELAKQTPFNKLRAKQLAEDTFADELVNRLDSQGSLRGKIAIKNTIDKKLGYLTTFETLSTAFTSSWNPEKRSAISSILSDFNEYLEFLIDEYEGEEILFNKIAFAAHVVIAREFAKDKDYDLTKELLNKVFYNTTIIDDISDDKTIKSYIKKVKKAITETEKLIK